MCTCSWIISPDHYELWFSRDEDRQRPASLPPVVNHRGKQTWISPIDPVGEGTWIFTNSHGLSACLLNFYDAPTVGLGAPEESRGQLMSALVGSNSLNQFEAGLLSQLAAIRFAPCRIVAIDREYGLAYWSWNGHEIISHGIQNPVGMLSSSSWNTKAVIEARQRSFRELVPKQPRSEHLGGFHLSRAPEGPAYSVCMSRPETQTVSLSRICFESGQSRFTYEERLDDGSFGMPEITEISVN